VLNTGNQHVDVGYGRAGRYVKQPAGYRAFLPAPLPPDPPLLADHELMSLLAVAERSLGRLDGATGVLPNPDLFVAMYVRKEALLSSQIEGTQASLVDVLEYEADPSHWANSGGVLEVVNHIAAMDLGLNRLQEFPLSLRLIREIHERLMQGVRGSEREPGEFRRSQNWIGPVGCMLADATHVPPPVHEMHEALHNLELFLHREPELPLLLKCGLVHSQFESIHPFLDGNGRIGRLLITFMLCHAQALSRPLLYLSYYFKRHRQEYYARLQMVREQGDWESWIKFFLRSVIEVSEQAASTAKQITNMQVEHRQMVQTQFRTPSALRLLDHLYHQPVVSIHGAAAALDVKFPTARRIVQGMEGLGLLREITGKQHYRLFAYGPYLDLLREGTDPEPPVAAA